MLGRKIKQVTSTESGGEEGNWMEIFIGYLCTRIRKLAAYIFLSVWWRGLRKATKVLGNGLSLCVALI